jgi:Rrf2 family protein
MILSKSSENAIRLVFYVNEYKSEREYFHIKDIAQHLELPYFQLAKIANTLIKENILKSFRGPSGGIKLNKLSSQITLIQIIRPFEDKDFLNRCILGLGKCGTHNPCPIHNHWEETKHKFVHLFQNKTLQDLEGFDPTGNDFLKKFAPKMD